MIRYPQRGVERIHGTAVTNEDKKGKTKDPERGPPTLADEKFLLICISHAQTAQLDWPKSINMRRTTRF